MPVYDYVVKVQPWGQKLGQNIRGSVNAPEEVIAEQQIKDYLFEMYGYVEDQDIVRVTLSIVEDVETERV